MGFRRMNKISTLGCAENDSRLGTVDAAGVQCREGWQDDGRT